MVSRTGALALRAAVAVLLALSVVLPGSAQARDIPAFRAMVTDQAGVLSPELRSRLEAQLLAYQRQTGHQLVLLIVPSLEGDAIEDFAVRVIEAWKPGDKARDDGVLFVVAMADRRMRIEPGYGLEGELTDAATARIIRDVITPHFKRGDPEAGIAAGLSAIMAATGGEGIPLPERPVQRSQRRSVGFPPLLLLALFVLPFLFGGRGGGGRRGRSWGAAPFILGGGFGGGRGGFGGGGGGFGGGGGGGFSGGGGGSSGGGGASGSW